MGGICIRKYGMKIRFHGTCACRLGKGRDYPAISVEVDGKIYLMDVGAAIVESLTDLDKNPADIRAIFVSDGEYARIAGLLATVDFISRSARVTRYSHASVDVYLPSSDLADAICAFYHEANIDENRVRLHAFFSSVSYSDENLKIEAIRAESLNDSYGFLLRAEGKCILFAGALSRARELPKLTAVVKEVKPDILVIEEYNADVEAAVSELGESLPRAIYLTRIGDKAKKYAKTVPVTDGVVIEV